MWLFKFGPFHQQKWILVEFHLWKSTASNMAMEDPESSRSFPVRNLHLWRLSVSQEKWWCHVLLVGGLEHVLWLSILIGNVILPTDELIFFRGVGKPPTRIFSHQDIAISAKMQMFCRERWTSTRNFLDLSWENPLYDVNVQLGFPV